MPRTRHTNGHAPEEAQTEDVPYSSPENVQTISSTSTEHQVPRSYHNRKVLPNLYWRALDMDRDLRGQSSRFVGLPPAEDLIIGGADSYR